MPVETSLCNVQHQLVLVCFLQLDALGEAPQGLWHGSSCKGAAWVGRDLGSQTAQPMGGFMQTQPWPHCHPGFEEAFQEGPGLRTPWEPREKG